MPYVIDNSAPLGWRHVPDPSWPGATGESHLSGLTYSRFVAAAALDPAAAGEGPDVLADTVAHLRAHLSSIADPDDDEDTHAADVHVELHKQPDGILVVGYLADAQPDAPYLREGYDPDTDHTGHTFTRWVPDGIDDDGGVDR